MVSKRFKDAKSWQENQHLSPKAKDYQPNKNYTPPATKLYNGKTKVFAYGTLNLHSVQSMLWGEEMQGRVATLPDFELRAFSNGIFYVVKRFGETVSGKIYELTKEQLELTDTYETKAYVRTSVKIKDDVVYVYVKAGEPDIKAVREAVSKAVKAEVTSEVNRDDTKVN